jgi:hypothetical protein
MIRYLLLFCLSGCTLVYGGAHHEGTSPDLGHEGGPGCTCTAPPAASCISSSTLRTYAKAGTCDGNACAYEYSDTVCMSGCDKSACVGDDPCDGIQCLTPPTNSCSGNTLTKYSPSGTCSAGACTYSASATTCTAPANATPKCAPTGCDFTCNEGYSRSGAQCVKNVVSGGGVTWTPATVGSLGALVSVWGSSASDFYVGDQLNALWHTTNGGASFTSQSLPNPSAQAVGITSVWGSSATNVYVCSEGTLYHSTDGSTFIATAYSCWAVWGTSASDVWALGYATGLQHATDGATFTANAELVNDSLNCIFGTSPSDIYVSGSPSSDGSGVYTAWHASDASIFGAASVGAAAISNGYGANCGYSPSVGTAYTFNGSSIYETTQSGSSWTLLTTLTGFTPSAIGGSGPTDLWLLGAAGALYHATSGSAWSAVSSGSTATFYQMWVSPDGSYWIVGTADTLLHGTHN